jgi:hypothetical protein
MYALILFIGRRTILADKKTAFRRVLGLLSDDYIPLFWGWDLVEMLRVFLLIGVYSLIDPGSIVQLFVAYVTALLHVVLQVQARPFVEISNNYLALSSSLSIVVIFSCCILFKMQSLSELEEVQVVMTDRMRHEYATPMVVVTTTLIATVGALASVTLIAVVQASQEQRKRRRDLRNAQSRRLRYQAGSNLLPANIIDGKEVEIHDGMLGPRLPDGCEYHCFLSHVWVTGQDQMRVVKTRLVEMLPEIKVFLEYVPGHDALPSVLLLSQRCVVRAVASVLMT